MKRAKSFSDHFSTQSKTYAEFRPEYPPAVFAWLNGLCKAHDLCWDVATGNGQAAKELARFFSRVYASDASEKQIAQSMPRENIHYAVEPAEKTSLESASVDLVTVAQAIHWFDHAKFYAEVKRVAKPGGVLAAWGYGLQAIHPAIDDIVHKYYSYIVGAYWPPERVLVEQHYKTLPFPFKEIAAPDFSIVDNYSLEQLMGYLESWSSTQRFIKERGENPMRLIAADLKKAWGNAARHEIRWPLFFKITRL